MTYSAQDRRDYATDGGAPHGRGLHRWPVVAGEEVIDALAAVACDGRDRPLKDVRMYMRILE